MALSGPFQAFTPQYCVEIGNSASTPIQILPTTPAFGASSAQYRIANYNSGPTQFVLTATSTPVTKTTTAESGAGFTILGGVTETFTGPPNAWFSCISFMDVAGDYTPAIFINGGDGL